MFKRILIAFDAGETARNAVDVAVELAREHGAALALVHVAAPPVAYLSDAGLAAQHVLDAEQRGAGRDPPAHPRIDPDQRIDARG